MARIGDPRYNSLGFTIQRSLDIHHRSKFITLFYGTQVIRFKNKITPSLRYYSKPATPSLNGGDLPNLPTKGTIAENLLNNDKYMIVYDNMLSMKRIIIEENKGKSGIYLIANKNTRDFYIGQAGDISKRYQDYISPGYIKRLNEKVNSIVGRAIKKYGLSDFTYTILEYCEKSDLSVREQYYFDKLKPVYNILKKVGGLPRGIIRSGETRRLMSIQKTGELNPLYGKSHSEETKELMRQKALGRKYSEISKMLMASKRGFSIDVHEKCSSVAEGGGFKLIGSFVSARKVGDF